MTDDRRYPVDPRGSTDANKRTVPSRPCCRRIGDWWCVLEEGHRHKCIPATQREVGR